jgi:hypothetical protein
MHPTRAMWRSPLSVRAAGLVCGVVLGLALLLGDETARARPRAPAQDHPRGSAKKRPGAAVDPGKHDLPPEQLARLATLPFDDPALNAALFPWLRPLLGDRFADFARSLGAEISLDLRQGALIGRGMTPHSADGEGSFYIFSGDGRLFASIRRGTAVDRFGATDLLADRRLKHAFDEFAGIDE